MTCIRHSTPAQRTMHLCISLLFMMILLTAPDAHGQPAGLQITITGLPDEIRDTVQKSLSLYAQKDHPLLNEALIRRLHKQAAGEIGRALQPFGYYRARVKSRLTHTGQQWEAQYRVDPGTPVRLSTVDVTLTGPGKSDPVLKGWLNDFPLHIHDILIHKTYEDAKQELLQLARDRGYFDGELVTHEIRVNLEQYQADLSLHYVTGPRYHFGAVTFVQDEFDDSFLKRYLPFHEGDPYDTTRLLRLRRALSDSDYFDRIDVTPQTEQPVDQAIPVTVKLVARKKHRYLAGVGYSTDTGARGTLGFENRRANSFGHHYDITLKKSEIRSSANARYLVPMQRPQLDYLTYSIGWVDENTDTTQRTTSSIAVDVTRQIRHWQQTTGLSYERERYKLGNRDNSTLLIPRAQWQRVRADRRIHTGEGWSIGLEARGASDAVLSDTSFMQGRVDAKYIYSFPNRNRLLLRTSGGASWTPELVELPASQRFLAGGDQSIRGYAYNSLGPSDDSGDVIGGKDLLVGSAEYEFNLTGKTNLALFFDAGNAFNTDEFDVKRGAGFGFRWQLPIGAIRIDLACALDRPGDPWRLHLTLGPDL